MTTIHIGSRKSKLAMWQTDTVAAMLEKSGMETQISSMETKGDKILDVSIAKIGSKGVFTEELEDQLSNGTTDIAVHSAKDMQSILPSGFELIAFTDREKSNDVLVSRNTNLDLTARTSPFELVPLPYVELPCSNIFTPMLKPLKCAETSKPESKKWMQATVMH